MAGGPLAVLGRGVDRAAVARRLRELGASVALDPPADDAWRTLGVTFGRLLGRKLLKLYFDPAHCSGESWARQMDGMRGYFSRFPETPRKERVLMLTHTFGFELGTEFVPDAASAGDPRMRALFDITEMLDGVLFSPSAMLDARGRVLLCVAGAPAEDPGAVWPRVAFRARVNAMPAGGDDDEDEPDPEATAPAAGRVAVRALALAALTARGLLEDERGHPGIGGTHAGMLAWARDVGAEAEMEPAEREVLRTPIGSLPRQAQVDAVWRLEGLSVLLWALGRAEIPPHDRISDAQTLWAAAGLLDGDAARRLLHAPVLRPRGEIGALRGRLFALHWRLRDFSLRRGAMDFAQFASTAWFGPLDVTGVPLVDGDLAIGGVRIDRAPPEALGNAMSAASERHLAANWLWEGPDTYSQADVST